MAHIINPVFQTDLINDTPLDSMNILLTGFRFNEYFITWPRGNNVFFSCTHQPSMKFELFIQLN